LDAYVLAASALSTAAVVAAQLALLLSSYGVHLIALSTHRLGLELPSLGIAGVLAAAAWSVVSLRADLAAPSPEG